MKRFLLILFLVGLGCTALSALVRYEYCVGGPGRGVSFAMTHPGHGPEPLEFVYEGVAIEGMVLDVGSLLMNVVTWSVFVGAPVAIVDLRRVRRSERRCETR